MADWVHKTREWLNSECYHSLGGHFLNVGEDDEADYLVFEDWLDWQCESGWEVIKILRDFSNKQEGIWCVFRTTK